MNTRQPDKDAPDSPAWFLNRCRDIDLIPWEIDLNGQPVSDPITKDRVKIWLCSSDVRMHLVDMALHWSTQEHPTRCTIDNTLHVLPFERVHRNRRIGYTIMIALEPGILDDPLLKAAFEEDGLALNATQHDVRPLVRDWEPNIDQIERLLHATYADAQRWTQDQEIIDGYTEQLSYSYETISSMHLLGRAIGQIENPNAFLEMGVELIGSTINAKWSALCINPVADDVGAPTIIQDGHGEIDDRIVLKSLERYEHTEPITRCDGADVYPADEHFERFGPQLIVHKLETHGKTYGAILVCGKLEDDQCVSSHDTKSLHSLSGIIASFLEKAQLYEEQRQTFLGIVHALSSAIDAKDPYTQGHSERVAMLGHDLALALGYTPEQAERVRLCGILHDVGKIGVPERILCKDGRLTDEEFDAIKRHPAIGATMIEGLPTLKDIIPGVLHHHERWDGRGYPGNLEGENIPEIGRILAIADTFDAMSSNRAYRAARPRDEVLAEIRRCSGSQFDPSMTDAFIALDFTQYDEAVEHHAAQTSYKDAA